MKPKLVRTLAALRRETAKWRKEGLSYAVVPTMGAIHSGHMELVTEGLERADRVITTIFVNPKQFAANEDLDKYPRDEDGDVIKLGKAGCHLIYLPDPAEIYPPGFCTTVTLGCGLLPPPWVWSMTVSCGCSMAMKPPLPSRPPVRRPAPV